MAVVAMIPPPPPPTASAAPGRLRSALYDLALRVRPTELGAALKRVAGVRRRYVGTADGLWLWVDPASRLGHTVLADGAYEPEMSAVLRAVLRPGDSFVDVGANEGVFSVLAAKLCGAGTVVAIEPQSRLMHVLHRNLEANACTRVCVRAVALDASPGWLRMYLRPNTNPGASGLTRRRLDVSTETVPATTLDAVASAAGLEAIRLIKVDCEGAEDRVIAGSDRLLRSRDIDYVALEFHPTVGPDGVERSRSVHARLLSYGYVHSVVAGRHVYHLPGGEAPLAAAGAVRVACDLFDDP